MKTNLLNKKFVVWIKIMPLVVIFSIIVFINLPYTKNYENCSQQKEFKSYVFQDIVKFAGKDHSNHNSQTIIFRNGIKILLQPMVLNSHELTSKIKSGDSIAKQKGKLYFDVYRGEKWCYRLRFKLKKCV